VRGQVDGMTLFMDIELVSAGEEEPPDAYAVAFDVIYSGETWCRSLVRLSQTSQPVSIAKKRA